jgi:tetratricopeptide (TPR) repeat protein
VSGAAAIGRRGKAASLLFALLAACGALVKVAGGSTVVAIGFAAIGVVGALVALALGVMQLRAEGREERAELWQRPPGKVGALAGGDGAYALGVDTEAREALDAAGLVGLRHAPYVSRDVDGQLRKRIASAASREAASLVILAGPSKAGKSRTLLEAARNVVNDASLIVPRNARALARLSGMRAPSEIGGGACVIWLDDIERFVAGPGEDGLSAHTLDGFKRWRRPVVVLACTGGKGGQLAGSDGDRLVEPISDLLRAHPPLELNPWLSPTERQALDGLESYSADGAERIVREGIGEFMIAASRLRERLASGASPEGLAVVRAAVDWRRLGLRRPISRDALRALCVHYPQAPDSESAFEGALRWATTPLYSHIALLHGRDVYEPYDYVVRYEQERGRPVPAETWEAVLDTYADERDLLSIGVAAWLTDDDEHSERAFRRADERGEPRAAFNLGVLLQERGERGGAEAAYRRGEDGGVSAASFNLGVLLEARGDLEGAEGAYRRADDRGDASAAVNLGRLLEERGDLEGAEAVYRHGDKRGIGPASYNLGVLLAQRGDFEGAEAAYRRGDERGDVNATFNLGVLQFERDDLEAAEAAYRRGDERGDARAATNLGALLAQRNDLDGAEAAWRRADERGDAHAADNLGLLFEQRGDLESAETAYRRADDRGHAPAAYHLGLRLERRGDIDAADAAWRRARDRAHADGDEELAEAASMKLRRPRL